MRGYVRPAAVAGRFYPGSRREIDAMLAELYAGLAPSPEPGVKGILAPHAGWIYSGLTAVRTYVKAAIPEVCVILCPNHTGMGESFSIQVEGAWETPMGALPIDEKVGRALLSGSTLLREDRRAHEREHAIEVHLPLLHHLKSDLRFVPICVASLRPGELATLGHEMAAVLETIEPRPLLVISSDMTHYEPAEAARRKDRRAIEQMEKVDAPGLHRLVIGESISMCGIAPATAALTALADLGATKGVLLDYTNSGDRTGDYSEVVAYAGLCFC